MIGPRALLLVSDGVVGARFGGQLDQSGHVGSDGGPPFDAFAVGQVVTKEHVHVGALNRIVDLVQQKHSAADSHMANNLRCWVDPAAKDECRRHSAFYCLGRRFLLVVAQVQVVFRTVAEMESVSVET